MQATIPVLEALARRYEQSRAGRTGIGRLDIQPKTEELLAEAGCMEGEARELAERQLKQAAGRGLITLEPAHRRDRANCFKVRISPAQEEAFFAHLGRPSPTAIRKQWRALFREAAAWPVSAEFAGSWVAFCKKRAEGALHWKDMSEFKRTELATGREMLGIVVQLLERRDREHFIRVVSCRICGESKRLENQRSTFEKLLTDASGARILSLADLGILETPKHVLVAGPLRLRLKDQTIDLGNSRDGVGISEMDIVRAEIECNAARCVTVENKTSFHQRAVAHPQDLHIHTSYPNAATLALLRKLPPDIEFLHAGDADPAGFDILRELRETSGRAVRSIGMEFHPIANSAILTVAEVRLLERLSCDQCLAPERAVLQTLLAVGKKGAFEQEHRTL